MFSEWDLLVFTAALSVAAFSPGPSLAAVVAAVLAWGARRTIWFCVGLVAGDVAWLTLSLSGLALIAQQVPMVFTAIKWAGVAYLIYLAVRIWRARPETAQTARPAREKGIAARILAGFSIAMGNPKTMLFYIALLPSLLNLEHIAITMIASLYLAVIAVLTVVLAIYMFAAEKVRNAMRSSRAIRKFNRITATALGGAAVWIAAK